MSFTVVLWAQVAEAESSALSPQNVSVAEPDLTPLVLTQPAGQEEPETTSTIWLFVRMILVLLAVIACIYGVVYLLKRSMNKTQPLDPYLKKVATLVLAQGRSVHIVTVGSQAFLIGVAESSVTLLGEIRDGELIDAMNLHAGREPAGKKPKDFYSMLTSFFPGVRPDKKKDDAGSEDISVSAAETEEFLRRQRERLRSDSFGSDGDGDGISGGGK